EVDLLPEIEIRGRTLARRRIAGAEEAGAVSVPGHAAAGGAAVDARHDITQAPAGARVVDVDGARFRAAFRDRDRDLRAVERGHVEVDRGATAGIELIRIDDQALARGAIERDEPDQHRLLLRRLILDREVDAVPVLQVAVGG